jgi:hypothetical protein
LTREVRECPQTLHNRVLAVENVREDADFERV